MNTPHLYHRQELHIWVKTYLPERQFLGRSTERRCLIRVVSQAGSEHQCWAMLAVSSRGAARGHRAGWPEEHYLFRLLTHLLPLRDEHPHQWPPTCQTSSKREKETRFQSHSQSRLSFPHLPLLPRHYQGILNYFTVPVEVAFKFCLQLTHFFPPSLEEIKQWQHHNWNCNPSY